MAHDRSSELLIYLTNDEVQSC